MCDHMHRGCQLLGTCSSPTKNPTTSCHLIWAWTKLTHTNPNTWLRSLTEVWDLWILNCHSRSLSSTIWQYLQLYMYNDIKARTHWDPSQSSWAAQGPEAPCVPRSWTPRCSEQGIHRSSGGFRRSWSWNQHQHLHGGTGGGLWMLWENKRWRYIIMQRQF